LPKNLPPLLIGKTLHVFQPLLYKFLRLIPRRKPNPNLFKGFPVEKKYQKNENVSVALHGTRLEAGDCRLEVYVASGQNERVAVTILSPLDPWSEIYPMGRGRPARA